MRNVTGNIIGMLVICAAAVSPAQELRFGNTSEYLGEGRWAWTVAIEGEPAALDQIISVDYILPPEISRRRLQTRLERANRFGLDGQSWSSFDLLAIVSFRGNPANKRLFEYAIVLDKPSSREVHIRNWARPVPDSDRWDWGIWVDEGPEVLHQIEHVEYTLHPTFKNRIRDVWDPDTQFELATNGWGTFRIDVLVFFKDGSTQATAHQLEFRGVPSSRVP